MGSRFQVTRITRSSGLIVSQLPRGSSCSARAFRSVFARRSMPVGPRSGPVPGGSQAARAWQGRAARATTCAWAWQPRVSKLRCTPSADAHFAAGLGPGPGPDNGARARAFLFCRPPDGGVQSPGPRGDPAGCRDTPKARPKVRSQVRCHANAHPFLRMSRGRQVRRAAYQKLTKCLKPLR